MNRIQASVREILEQKNYAAAMVQREHEIAWKNAYAKLTVQDLWK